MYLKKKIYVGAEYEHRKVKANVEITVNGKKLPINPANISEIVESAIYWRKANAIHKWFVDKVQGGEDDCAEYEVGTEDLELLRNDCLEAIKKQDPSILPPSSGFFFGSTEVDEYYWGELQRTADEIEAVLPKTKEEGFGVDFYYRASW